MPQQTGTDGSQEMQTALNAPSADVFPLVSTDSDAALREEIMSRQARADVAPGRQPATAGTAASSSSAPTSTTPPSETAVAPEATTEAAPSASVRIPIRSAGLAWASGAYVPGSSPAEYAAFGAWRGRPLDVVVDWAARSSWSDIENPDWVFDAWAHTQSTVVLGMAMVPEDGSTLSACASGAYTAHWDAFGRAVAASGLADHAVIRLGWEFNGDWYAWSAHDPDAYAACWRSVVTTVERHAPALRWDWTVNRGPGQSLSDARRAWPGDAYVDIVGVDSYDMWPAVRTDADWAEHLDGPYGLRFWADFAAAHGKQLSVPEWGVYPGSGSGGSNGGDNPFYVEQMVGFFRSLGPQLAYEAYFNEPAGYIAASLFGPVQNPLAAAAYRESYRAS